jgi:hypothetical protein
MPLFFLYFKYICSIVTDVRGRKPKIQYSIADSFSRNRADFVEVIAERSEYLGHGSSRERLRAPCCKEKNRFAKGTR